MLSEGSLRVHGAQLSDAGRYYCTVTNQAGSDHRGVELRVFGKYSKEKCYIICNIMYHRYGNSSFVVVVMIKVLLLKCHA